MSPRLVADIGGTNTRIALFDSHLAEFRHLVTYTNRDYPHFEDVIATWLASLPETAPDRACVAIAALLARDQVVMTNMEWSFSRSAIARRFGFKRIRWINDFEANAIALPHLTGNDSELLYRGNSPEKSKLAVIGPGTGLGGATLEPFNHLWHACACEPGHMSISPANDLEIELFRELLRRRSHIYAELLVSGPGLLLLYKTLGDITDTTADASSAAEVSRRALGREDETGVLALSTFSALLGSVSGDFALANGAYGGLYLAGGIVPTMIPFLRASDFHSRFCAKGAMRERMNEIPVYAITTIQPGLIGAAHAAID